MDAEKIMKIAKTITLIEEIQAMEMSICAYCGQTCLINREVEYNTFEGKSFPVTTELKFCSDFKRRGKQ